MRSLFFFCRRYDNCLSLIKSACKKADEDFDDPFIVLLCLHAAACSVNAYSFIFIFRTGSYGVSPSRHSACSPHRQFCGGCTKQQQQQQCPLHPLCRPVQFPSFTTPRRRVHMTFLRRYSAMQNLESQFTHSIAVPRCYHGTDTPVVPGFVPAGAMLPLPR